jgi:hypothetical protein
MDKLLEKPKMTELEAWKFLAEKFKEPIGSNVYNLEGLCLGVACLTADLTAEPFITDLTCRTMRERMKEPHNTDWFIYNFSGFWYPVTPQGHTKRVAWIEKQIAELEK